MSLTRHQALGAFQRWELPSFDEPDPGSSDASALPDTALNDAQGAFDPHTRDATAADADAHAASVEDAAVPTITLPTADEIEAIYEQARSEGHASGHAEGFQTGLEQGRAEGLQQGLQEGLQQGQQQGHAEGLEQGRNEGLQAVEQEASQLAALVGNLQQAVQQVDQDVAEELVAFAIELARNIVHRTLSDHPDTILDTVRKALQQLPQNAINLHLHPDDAALVQQHMAEQLAHGEHHIVEDAQLQRGDCILETATSRVDATLHTRWRRVLNDLGHDDVAWNDDTP